jgi:hypothetical protein
VPVSTHASSDAPRIGLRLRTRTTRRRAEVLGAVHADRAVLERAQDFEEAARPALGLVVGVPGDACGGGHGPQLADAAPHRAGRLVRPVRHAAVVEEGDPGTTRRARAQPGTSAP